MNIQPCHPGKHKLAPDIEAYLRNMFASTSMIKVARLLSSGPETLLALVDVGAAENTRNRIEKRVAGLMLAEGLSPTLRPESAQEAALKGARTRKKSKEDRGWFGLSRELRERNVLEELDGVRLGQVWKITEPNGHEVLVTVKRLIAPNLNVAAKGGHGAARAVGLTASGKRRMLWLKGLVKTATLVQDAPAPARSA